MHFPNSINYFRFFRIMRTFISSINKKTIKVHKIRMNLILFNGTELSFLRRALKRRGAWFLGNQFGDRFNGFGLVCADVVYLRLTLCKASM